MADPPGLNLRTAVIIAAIVLLALVSWSTIAGQVPSALSPHSFAVVIPMFEGGEAFAVTMPPLLFLLWSVNLIAGHERLPVRSLVMFSVVSLGCIVWFVSGWKHGVAYQGLGVTSFWAVANVLLMSLMWVLALRCRRAPAWRKTILFHWLLFAWPSWCGFPWLGELI